jgi:hypothetical protein
MKKYLLSAALVLSMGATFAFGTDGEHLKGYIADAKCGASNMGSTAERIACTKKCIKGGSEAVLVVGDKVYKISNQKAAIKYAGKNVTVDGTVTNDSVEITKITEDKS